eukprot:gene10170-10328_t
MAVAVAAIKALTGVIKNSTAQTMMGLEKELKDAAVSLQRCNPTAISLKAGCELFLRYTTRTSALELEDFKTAKARLIEDINFSVVVTEGRPDGTGQTMARALDALGVPVTLVLDCGVAYALERIDLVLVGAEGVVENGGVINKLGTYQIALCAKSLNKPFYVAAESYKFARLYPLNQQDLPLEHKPVDVGPLLPRSVAVDNPSRDYTPPAYINLLVTDLGVLTPAAVSDELIQLYV